MINFRIGDIVQLVSGGPKMTVTCGGKPFGPEDERIVKCSWFVGNKLKEGIFPVKALRYNDNHEGDNIRKS